MRSKINHLNIVTTIANVKERRIRPYLKPTNDSFWTDETYIKVKRKWKYLYRAVDSNGNTIDFMLSENRDTLAAKRFFKKALTSSHNQIATHDHCR